MAQDPTPTLFCLHFLGGSARQWRWLERELDGAVRLVVLDLPGFGDRASDGGRDVAAMAEHVVAAVRADARPGGRWGLAGHSMGAKVSLAVARRAEDGEAGLEGLSRLVLLAGSPPAPEPMEEAQRAEMLGWFAGPPGRSEGEAREYLSRNVGAALPAEMHAQALSDVLRAHPGAWRDWLERGSREDWRERVGVLHTPALVVAGSEDGALGPDAQRRHMLPHLARGRLAVMEGVAHLPTLERPAELARLILAHLREEGHDATPARTAPAPGDAASDAPSDLAGSDAMTAPTFASLLDGDRIATPLRRALHERARADDPAYRPQAMDAAALRTLRAVLGRVVPRPAAGMDLAARLDARLTREGNWGDGWRPATLPPDGEALRVALATLDAAAGDGGFAGLDAAAQDALLRRCAAGELSPGVGPGGADLGGARAGGSTSDTAGTPRALNATAMRAWFTDLCGIAVRLHVSHPATLARMGYGGVFAGGDDVRTATGFRALGEGRREAWEPEPEGVHS